MAGHERQLGVTTKPGGSWVQVERAAMERWARLALDHPRAAALMMNMVAQMGRHNALVASQKTLMSLVGCSLATLKRSLEVLKEGRWIEVRQIGPTGTACAYIINDQVAWTGKREGIRYSLFSASILISDFEQPDSATMDHQEPLERLPALFKGERQLPIGPGLDPPTQPPLTGLEPDLPALPKSRRFDDMEDIKLNTIADARQNEPVVRVELDDL